MLEQSIDLDHEVHLRIQIRRIRQTEIGEDIYRSDFDYCEPMLWQWRSDRILLEPVGRGTNFDGKGMRWDIAYTRTLPTVVTAEMGYSIGA